MYYFIGRHVATLYNKYKTYLEGPEFRLHEPGSRNILPEIITLKIKRTIDFLFLKMTLHIENWLYTLKIDYMLRHVAFIKY